MYFGRTRGIIKKSKNQNSSKLVDFVQALGPYMIIIFYYLVKSMQRSETEAIRNQIQPSNPEQEINNITKQSKYKENILVRIHTILCKKNITFFHLKLSFLEP